MSPQTPAALMGDVQLLTDLYDATDWATLDAARLAAIKSGRIGAVLVAPEFSDAYLVLAGIDPAWSGAPRTLAAWVSAVTVLKVLEFGQQDGTAAPVRRAGILFHRDDPAHDALLFATPGGAS